MHQYPPYSQTAGGHTARPPPLTTSFSPTQIPQNGTVAQPSPSPHHVPPRPPDTHWDPRFQQHMNSHASQPSQSLYPVLQPVGVSGQDMTGGTPTVASTGSRRIGPYPRAPRKRALLIGCNYPHSPCDALKSCVNDAFTIKHTLIVDFGYTEENVQILVDDVNWPDQFPPPTRQNIIKCIKWLVKDAQCGDKLFFHFSGHGTCSMDHHREERSGTNQCLMPTDYAQSGVIVDDDINRFLVRPLPVGCTLHALVDCCHSGTVMDLQFVAEGNGWTSEGATRAYKGTSGGYVFQFAACRDVQSAFESEAGNASCGAATTAFIEAILSNRPVTYGQVLTSMETQVRKATAIDRRLSWEKVKGALKHPVQHVLGRQYQRPQLSSNTDLVSLNCEMCI